ncbi:MAG: HD domain-containing protein [Litorilinea sp.]
MTANSQPPSTDSRAQLHDWRQICQALAQQQAEDEAFAAWPIEDGATVPFQHRWEHVMEVARIALGLAEETGADLEIVEAAAWLHDVRKEQSKHAEAGAREARQILYDTDFPTDKIEAVVEAIRRHSGSVRPRGAPSLEPLEAAVLWDADKLSKLGVSALSHRLSSHTYVGMSLHERRAELDEYVHDKVRKIVESMNTEPARRYAEERYAAMVQMLDAWLREEDEPKA